MSWKWVVFVVGVVCLWAGVPARAASLVLAPAAATIDVGETIDFDVMVIGLGDGEPPSLGAYDLDVAYDPSVLHVEFIAFTQALGRSFANEATYDSSFAVGVVDLAGVSLLSPTALDAWQIGGHAVLGMIRFTGLAPGETALSFTQIVLGDGFGEPLPLDTTTGASILVTPVPEPSIALLVGAGVVALARRQRARGEARA